MTHGELHLFIGDWEYIADKTVYEVGTPPKEARYHIQPLGDKISFIAEWTASDESQHRVSYLSIPDGNKYPFENPSLADTISSNLLDRHTLDTAVAKDGVVISYARRALSEDGGIMTITQSGFTPDGKPFTNVSVYKKL